jgi:hypothetical protein
MNLSTADLRNYRTEFHETWWDNVEFLPPIFMPCFGSHFGNGRHLENFENAELLL